MNLHEHCAKQMKAGSKSFSVAAQLFPTELRQASQLLYAWCRRCDDAIDSAPNEFQALQRWQFLTAETKKVLSGNSTSELAFQALGAISIQYNIPNTYAEELLAGMHMDICKYKYRSEKDLILYCFRVAGVVGLMMCHIMQAKSRRALLPAVQAGIALQLTNIARDVKEDFYMGRIYFPEDWLKTEANNLLSQSFSAKSFLQPVQRLLELADWHYQEAEKGLAFLPLRSSIAIAAALEIYREIGVEVKLRGMHAWDNRVVIGRLRKLWLAVRGAYKGSIARKRWSDLNLSTHNSTSSILPAFSFTEIYEQPIELPQFLQM